MGREIMGFKPPPMSRTGAGQSTQSSKPRPYKISNKRFIWVPLSGGSATLMAVFTFLFLKQMGRSDWFAFGVIMILLTLIITPISFYCSEENELKRLQVLEKLDR